MPDIGPSIDSGVHSLTPALSDVRLLAAIEQARRDIHDGRPATAVEGLGSALDRAGWIFAAAWSVLGQAHLAAGDEYGWNRAMVRSVATLDAVVAPGSPTLAAEIGLALSYRSRSEEAVAVVQDALRMGVPSPALLSLAERLGVNPEEDLSLLSDVDRALRHATALRATGDSRRALEVVESIDGRDPRITSLWIRLLLDVGDVDGASRIVLDASNDVPDVELLLRECAEAQVKSGNNQAVLALTDRLIPGNRLETDWMRQRSVALFDLGRIDEALAEIDAALELAPDDVGLLFTRAYERWSAGRADGLADIDLAHSQLGDQPAVLALRARIRMAAGDARGARADTFRAKEIAILPADVRSVATLLWDLEEQDQALGLVDRALASDASQLELLALRRDMYRARNEFESAIADARRLETLLPSQFLVACELASLLVQVHKADEALAVLERFDADLSQSVRGLVCLSEALAELGQADEALVAAQQAVALGPTEGYALLNLAQRLAGSRDHSAALEAFESVLRIEVDHLGALRGRAEMLAMIGRADDARKAFEHIVELAPTEDSYFLLVRFLQDSGALEEGLAVIDVACVVLPGNALLLGVRGQLLKALQRLPEAIASFEAAAEADGERFWVQLELGEAKRLLGDYEGALVALDAALALEPVSPFALATKGEVLLSLGQPDEALELIRQANEIEPVLWSLLAEAGALCELKRYEEAMAIIDKVRGDGADAAETLSVETRVLIAQERFDKVQRLLDEARLAPDNPLAMALQFLVEVAHNRFEEAIGRYEEALDTAPEIAERLGALAGRVLIRVQRIPDGTKLLEQELEVERNIENVSGLAAAYYRAGDERAAELFEEALDMFRQKPEADSLDFETASWCSYRLGRIAEATAFMQRAVQFESALVSARFGLAYMLLTGTKFDIAVEEYEAAIKSCNDLPDRRRAWAYIDDAQYDLAMLKANDRSVQKVRDAAVEQTSVLAAAAKEIEAKFDQIEEDR